MESFDYASEREGERKKGDAVNASPLVALPDYRACGFNFYNDLCSVVSEGVLHAEHGGGIAVAVVANLLRNVTPDLQARRNLPFHTHF